MLEKSRFFFSTIAYILREWDQLLVFFTLYPKQFPCLHCTRIAHTFQNNLCPLLSRFPYTLVSLSTHRFHLLTRPNASPHLTYPPGDS